MIFREYTIVFAQRNVHLMSVSRLTEFSLAVKITLNPTVTTIYRECHEVMPVSCATETHRLYDPNDRRVSPSMHLVHTIRANRDSGNSTTHFRLL